MIVEEKLRKTIKLQLTSEEKAQRKAMIEMLTNQVVARITEFDLTASINRKLVQREVTKAYDKKIRKAVLESLKA